MSIPGKETKTQQTVEKNSFDSKPAPKSILDRLLKVLLKQWKALPVQNVDHVHRAQQSCAVSYLPQTCCWRQVWVGRLFPLQGLSSDLPGSAGIHHEIHCKGEFVGPGPTWKKSRRGCETEKAKCLTGTLPHWKGRCVLKWLSLETIDFFLLLF